MSKKETIIVEDFSQTLIIAKRTAFITRLIVLREKRRSRAHRFIERLVWDDFTTAEDLAERIRAIFKSAEDPIRSYEPDLKKALKYAKGLYFYFVPQYAARATSSFLHALLDYEYSNKMLFTKEDSPGSIGWRMPNEIARENQQIK